MRREQGNVKSFDTREQARPLNNGESKDAGDPSQPIFHAAGILFGFCNREATDDSQRAPNQATTAISCSRAADSTTRNFSEPFFAAVLPSALSMKKASAPK